jgi:hypothetical protein
MTIITAKLSQLRLSALNVRTLKPASIEAMADDIAAHGLLQNLVAYEEDGCFQVFAGGRRLRGLSLLKKRKSITGSYEVAIDGGTVIGREFPTSADAPRRCSPRLCRVA